MKKIIILAATLSLSGCSTLLGMLSPSKWDENQTAAITDIRLKAETFDCKKDLQPQLDELSQRIEWVHLYSQFKGTKDIDHLFVTMKQTVVEFSQRAAAGPVSPSYCTIKKLVISNQADIIGYTIKGNME